MRFVRHVVVAGCVAAAVAVPAVDARAGQLSDGVRRQVEQAVQTALPVGNAQAIASRITDLCSENPGVALDIVAYAGELAAQWSPDEWCAVSNRRCDDLDDLFAMLLGLALRTDSGRRAMARLESQRGSVVAERPSTPVRQMLVSVPPVAPPAAVQPAPSTPGRVGESGNGSDPGTEPSSGTGPGGPFREDESGCMPIGGCPVEPGPGDHASIVMF